MSVRAPDPFVTAEPVTMFKTSIGSFDAMFTNKVLFATSLNTVLGTSFNEVFFDVCNEMSTPNLNNGASRFH